MTNARDESNPLSFQPGKLRHHLTLLEPSTGTDASGVVTTFAPSTPPVMAWAAIEGLSAEDQIRSGQDISTVQLRITIRYNPAFTANKRLQKWNGNQYIIKGVENVMERNVKLVMMCEGIGLNA